MNIFLCFFFVMEIEKESQKEALFFSLSFYEYDRIEMDGISRVRFFSPPFLYIK